MEVTLDAVAVHLPGNEVDFFHVESDPHTKQFWGRADSESRSLEALAKMIRPDYMKIALKAKDFVAASEELRTILARRWRGVLETTYWFYVGPNDDQHFYIDETDPLHRQAITLGSYTGNLSRNPGHKRSADFFRKIERSDLILGATWKVGLDEIDIYLTPEAADPANRLKTYRTLLEQF